MKRIRFSLILLCIFCLLFSSSCGVDDTDDISNRFEVHYIDVGQGDAALILCDDKTMLIDGGKPEASSIIYTYLRKQKIEKLDYIVCSHADDDHIGGLSAPLTNMEVGEILAPKTQANTKSYKNILKKAKEKGITIRHPKYGESMDFAGGTIDFYGPITESDDDRNNGSVVMKVIYGQTSFLFTGDAEREEEMQILETYCDISATVLKVGHHGSKNSTTYPFLREIMPKYAIISVGDNSYGHPDEDVLSRLRDADVTVYRTDMQGDIIAKSDGKTVGITVSKNKNIQTNTTETESLKVVQAEQKATEETKTYVANDVTKKFHCATCRTVKKMSEENKIYLNCTREDLIAQGYEACKICNP